MFIYFTNCYISSTSSLYNTVGVGTGECGWNNELRVISVIKTSQLMLYREIIALCSETHTKHINPLCGQKVELLNVKLVVHIVTTGV